MQDNDHQGKLVLESRHYAAISTTVSSIARQAEPRVGVAYNIKKTNTILRVSYARTLESPFNENLILSSLGCANPVLDPLLLCTSPEADRLSPGFRNEFHAGIEQAFGKYVVFSGE